MHGNNPYLFLSFPRIIGTSCFLIIFGLLFCEFWSVVNDFKRTTSTACFNINKQSHEAVWNFLPSISAATSGTPQRYVWQICVALHCTPRFLIAKGYHSLHRSLFLRTTSLFNFANLAKLAFFLHVVEIGALVGLSFISSTDNYEIHKFCFATFMFCATLHMLSMCLLYGPGLKSIHFSLDKHEQKSFWLKKTLTVLNISSFVFALYFFYRHNTYCEDGVYSLFGLCEILVVLTNVAFHGTAMLDFRKSKILLQGGSSLT